MNRYSDEPCVKCGNEAPAESEWIAEQIWPRVGKPRVTFPEMIRRTCTRCGYAWFQKPLDTQ